MQYLFQGQCANIDTKTAPERWGLYFFFNTQSFQKFNLLPYAEAKHQWRRPNLHQDAVDLWDAFDRAPIAHQHSTRQG